MPSLRGDARVICADSSAERLEALAKRLLLEKICFSCTRSAAECLAMAAQADAAAVVLDCGLLYVDLENIPEYIARINAAIVTVLTVEDPLTWNRHQEFVHTVIRRGDLDSLVPILRELH